MAAKNGKVVLITGANKGLAKELGRQLGALGYTVVLTARDEQAGKAAAAELVAAGYDAHTVRLEVTNSDDISGLVSYIETTFGKLDVLVNNAGVMWNPKTITKDGFESTNEHTLADRTVGMKETTETVTGGESA